MRPYFSALAALLMLSVPICSYEAAPGGQYNMEAINGPSSTGDS